MIFLAETLQTGAPSPLMSSPPQVDFFSTEATALTDAEIIPCKERQIKCKSASFFFFFTRGGKG